MKIDTIIIGCCILIVLVFGILAIRDIIKNK